MDLYTIIYRHNFMYLQCSMAVQGACVMEGISSFDASKDHLLGVSSFFDNNVRIISYDTHAGAKGTYFVSGRDGDGAVLQY